MAALLLLGSTVAASDEPARSRPVAWSELSEQVRMRLAAGEPRKAISLLKHTHERRPDFEPAAVALAQAYLADENPFWAQKTLVRYLENNPGACDARVQLGWVYLEQALVPQAQTVLEDRCRDSPAANARRLLLLAYAAEIAGEPAQAAKYLQLVRRSPSMYREDVELLQQLGSKHTPGRLPPLAGHLEVGAGWTSNGLAGSPTDPAVVRDPGSVMGTLNGGANWVAPTGTALRPTAELALQAQGWTSAPASDLSYLKPSARVGVLIARLPPRLAVVYAYDSLLLAGGDRYTEGPLLYSAAHRLEYELEAGKQVLLFGGVGHRQYRERGRTRFELNQGVGWSVALGDTSRLFGGVSCRVHSAIRDAYNMYGVTSLLRASRPVVPGLELTTSASLSSDWYPDSSDAFVGSQGAKRQEQLLQGAVELWFDAWPERLGLLYQVSRRDSTAVDYSYTEHRLTLQARWDFQLDDIGRELVDHAGRIPADYHLAQVAGGGRNAQLREWMRQDESVKQSSSCLK